MSQAIKRRILAEVQRRIADESSTYICWALEDIAADDHRRIIHVLCRDLQAEVQAYIAPYKTFGDYVLAHSKSVTAEDVKTARLAWLGEALLTCQ